MERAASYPHTLCVKQLQAVGTAAAATTPADRNHCISGNAAAKAGRTAVVSSEAQSLAHCPASGHSNGGETALAAAQDLRISGHGGQKNRQHHSDD